MQPSLSSLDLPFYNAFVKLFSGSDRAEYNFLKGKMNIIIGEILEKNVNNLSKCILDISNTNSLDEKVKEKAINLANKLIEVKGKYQESIQHFEEKIGDAKDPSTIRATALFIKYLMGSKEDDFCTRIKSVPNRLISEQVKSNVISCFKDPEFKAELNKNEALYLKNQEVKKGQESKVALIENELKSLDTDYLNLSLSCNYPMKVPEILLNQDEKQKIDQAFAKVEELEKNLLNKYETEFESFNWHGRTSFQRIIWQDEGFLDAVQDPLVLKAILIRANQNKEPQLGKAGPLSQLMLYALGSNQISYLLTTTPNFYRKPSNDTGATWGHLRDMRIHYDKGEDPREVSLERLQSANKALASLKEILAPHFPSVSHLEDSKKINHDIMKMSVSELIEKFGTEIDTDQKIRGLTYSAAGDTTRPNRMAGQCFEVMLNYDKLLKFHDGDHSKVLGYGLVTHALDAKHLAAALYTKLHPTAAVLGYVKMEYNNALEPGIQTFNQLIQDAAEGKLDPTTTVLLKVRLQQLMSIIEGLRK